MWHENGQLHALHWMVENTHHREDGPAHIEYSPSGEITLEDYFIHGVRHRDGDLPARTYRDPESGNYTEAYVVNGQLHRANGPASTEIDPWEGTRTECWYRYGKEHRSDGPAVIIRKLDTDEVIKTEYYRNGVKVRKPAPAAKHT